MAELACVGVGPPAAPDRRPAPRYGCGKQSPEPSATCAPARPAFPFLGIESFPRASSLASIGLFIKPGLNYGIDFVGGVLIEVMTAKPADLAGLRSELGGAGPGRDSRCRNSATPSTVLVRLQRQPGRRRGAACGGSTRAKAVIETVEPDVRFERVEVVGPKVSG